MNFSHTTIYVKNMEESLKFYQELVGLPVAVRFPTDTGEITFLGDEATKVELIYNKEVKGISYGEYISIGFAVETLDETIGLMKEKGVNLETGIIQPNPHTRFVFVLDPNGLRVQFVESK